MNNQIPIEKLVRKEMKNLRQLTLPHEKERLKTKRLVFSPYFTHRCIYGLLFQDSVSERALAMKFLCTNVVYDSNTQISTDNIISNRDKYLSPMEFFILWGKREDGIKIISYILMEEKLEDILFSSEQEQIDIMKKTKRTYTYSFSMLTAIFTLLTVISMVKNLDVVIIDLFSIFTFFSLLIALISGSLMEEKIKHYKESLQI